jgi:hypothetical protein
MQILPKCAAPGVKEPGQADGDFLLSRLIKKIVKVPIFGYANLVGVIISAKRPFQNEIPRGEGPNLKKQHPHKIKAK